MLITPAAIRALQTSFSTRFRDAYGEAETWHDRVCTTVPSSNRSNTYGWMARLPQMRQWLGPRTLQNVTAHSYTLDNESFELSVAVQREDYEDSNLGTYAPLMADMGRAARKWPDQLATAALQGGVVNLGFDGLPFFSAAHPLAPVFGVQSNNFPATALTPANYATVRENMASYLGEDDTPLGVMPNLLVVPPQLERQAREILQASIIANAAGTAGISNVLTGSADLIVVPELAGQPTTWYLADTSKAMRGLVFQLRKAPELVSKAASEDDNVFFDRQLIWGVDSRGAVGYGPWFLMARAIA